MEEELGGSSGGKLYISVGGDFREEMGLKFLSVLHQMCCLYFLQLFEHSKMSDTESCGLNIETRDHEGVSPRSRNTL